MITSYRNARSVDRNTKYLRRHRASSVCLTIDYHHIPKLTKSRTVAHPKAWRDSTGGGIDVKVGPVENRIVLRFALEELLTAKNSPRRPKPTGAVGCHFAATRLGLLFGGVPG